MTHSNAVRAAAGYPPLNGGYYSAASQVNLGMSHQEIAKRLVFDYVQEHLDGTNCFTEDEVSVVWFAKALGNWKALLTTTFLDGMYYEVTFDGLVNIAYLDVYKKSENRAIAITR
jgi:hypothetical protein